MDRNRSEGRAWKENEDRSRKKNEVRSRTRVEDKLLFERVIGVLPSGSPHIIVE